MRIQSLNLFARLRISKSSAEKKEEMENNESGGGGGSSNNNGRCYLLELPTELLAMISENLDPLSGACLSLTCKRLLVISAKSLVSDTLQFKKDFAPLFHHYRSSHSFGDDRWKLVVRLEDDRWLACSKCLKLHPRSAFTSKELRRIPDQRVCDFGEMAGIVDLCPCKKLTFQDKVNMAKHLKDRESLTRMPSSILGSRRYDERYLWHSCTAKYGTTETRIELYPEIGNDGSLMMRTEYRLYVEPNRLGRHQHITPRFGCAHRSVDLWLSSVCQTLYCHRYNSYCSACKRINVCSTCETTLKCPKKRPFHCQETNRMFYFFWTQRNLGRSNNMPDKEWAVQRTHPVEPHVTWSNCRELCPWTIRMHPPPPHAPSLDNDILNHGEEFSSQVYTSLHLGELYPNLNENPPTCPMELDPNLYTVAWIAPLEIEAKAALYMLDNHHQGRFTWRPGYDYLFHAGDINGHNVIIATLPAGQEYGTGSAAALAGQIKTAFPNIRFGLLVGVAAGLPNPSKIPPRDIRLGDVLVGLPDGESAGLVAYDLGKETKDGFQLLHGGHALARTGTIVRSAIGQIKIQAPNDADLFLPFYRDIQDQDHANGNFLDPGQDQDTLYAVDEYGVERAVKRNLRPGLQRTRVWYGPLGSGEKLMKNAKKRNELRDKYNIIGLEMEAAGTMNQIPVGVIRGVCDYGDEHKNKEWQPYASAMAAAYAKAILYQILPRRGTSRRNFAPSDSGLSV